MHKIPKILLIDEDARARELTRQVLAAELAECDIIGISTLEHYRCALDHGGFSLVITEYRQVWVNAFFIFAELYQRYPGLPVIMLTEEASVRVAVRAIKQGFADYVMKRDRQALSNAVIQALRRYPKKVGYIDDDKGIPWCEKWGQVISKLATDFAYSIRIKSDGQWSIEWLTEPFKRFLDIHRSENSNACNEHLFHFGLKIHPDDQILVERHRADVLNGNEDIVEYRILTCENELRCFREHALPIRDGTSGLVTRVYGTVQDITWRRDAEDRLRLMQRAIDSSKNGIIITGLADTDYGITYVNRAFLDLTGYCSDELIGHNCRLLQRSERDQAGIQALREALRNNQDGYAILRNYRKDGSAFWNEIYISPVTDASSRVTHYLGVQNDVTPRIEMELALTQSEMKMRAVFQSVSEAILIFDQQGSITLVNQSAEKIFGYVGDEMIGLNLDNLLPDLAGTLHSADKPNSLEDDEVLEIAKQELTASKKDGSPFLVKVSVREIRSDSWRLFVATARDLTEDKRAQASLKANEERYRALFENSTEAIFVNRGGRCIEEINSACLKLWGVATVEQLLAKKPLELFHPAHRRSIAKRIRNGISKQAALPMTEEKILRLDGSEADVLVSGASFADEKGPLQFLLLRDISERKASEAALRDSHKRVQDLSRHLEMAREDERTRIAREIHDDLGAFLTALKLELSWLEQQLPPELRQCRAKTHSMIVEVDNGIQSVKRIITELRPSLLDHLGLLPAIEWLVENFHQRSGIHCTLTLPDAELKLDSHRSTTLFRITQEALTNILVHAKATEVVVTIELKNSHLLLTISDNGCGMTPMQQDQTEGFGILGMRERANYLNADLNISSLCGKGTLIKLSMPLPSTDSEPAND